MLKDDKDGIWEAELGEKVDEIWSGVDTTFRSTSLSYKVAINQTVRLLKEVWREGHDEARRKMENYLKSDLSIT